MKKTHKSVKKLRAKNVKKSNDPSGKVFGFRWLKKLLAGKSNSESMDLLDQWILKKRALSLFF